MTLLSVVLRLLRVRRGRTTLFLLTLTISLSIILTINAVSLGMRATFKAGTETAGNLYAVTTRSDRRALTYRGIVVGETARPERVPLAESVVRAVQRNTDVLGALNMSPSRIDVVKINGTPSILVSTDLRREREMKKWWEIEGELPRAAGELLVGSSFASELGIAPGASLSVDGEVRLRRVRGVLRRTGRDDDRVVFAQTDGVDRVDLLLIESTVSSPTAIVEILESINPDAAGATEVSIADAASPLRYSFLESFSRYAALLSAVLAGLGVLLVYVFGITSVHGRISEFATLKSMGYRRSKIAEMVALELFIFCLVAVVLANVLMLASVAIIEASGRLDGFVLSRVPLLRLFAASWILTTVACVVAGLRPALKASGTDVVRGLRAL